MKDEGRSVAIHKRLEISAAYITATNIHKPVLDVVKNENLTSKIMLGTYLEAEMNNFNCPWGGGVYSE